MSRSSHPLKNNAVYYKHFIVRAFTLKTRMTLPRRYATYLVRRTHSRSISTRLHNKKQHLPSKNNRCVKNWIYCKEKRVLSILVHLPLMIYKFNSRMQRRHKNCLSDMPSSVRLTQHALHSVKNLRKYTHKKARIAHGHVSSSFRQKNKFISKKPGHTR